MTILQFIRNWQQISAILCIFLLLSAPPVQADTALPVITITASQLNEHTAKSGSISVSCPDGTYLSSPAAIKYRGTYSASFTLKRNYSFHLKDENGLQRKESLLNLRCDDDYTLLGGYSDASRLRILTGLDLFRDAVGPAPEGRLCEVYFGPYYKGIYTLTERPDRKSANVPRDGALYRVLTQSVDGINLLSDDVPLLPAQGDAWYNIEKVYASDAVGWQPLERLQQFLRTADEAAFSQHIGDYLQLSAFADYYLFVNLTGASDNMEKNLYLRWDGQRFSLMAWDLDAAFGRLYNAEPSDAAAWYSSALFDRLLELPAFQQLLCERYRALRPLFLPDAVCARFEHYADILEKSGALQREAERFSSYTDITTGKTHQLDVRGEIDFIRSFLICRLSLMDAAFLDAGKGSPL